MTIQGRILVGQVAVAGLLLVPAIYAVVCLGEVAWRTHDSLQNGLDRMYVLDQLRSEFEKVVQIKTFSKALSLDPSREHDPEIERKTDITLAQLRKTHVLAQAKLAAVAGEERPDLPRLAALLLEPAGSPAGGSLPLPDDAASPAPGTERAPPDAAPAWTDEDTEAARREIIAAYNGAGRDMLDETTANQKHAMDAMHLGLAGLLVAIPLAFGFSILALRALRKPLRRLMSATLAVSAGKFGISVPVTGDDEMSRLTDAFNKMSENLATFEKMTADFLSIASHELRSPLTCMKGYVGALRATLPASALENEEIARYLERIDREADLMASKVSELLTFGMIEAGQLRLESREIVTGGFLVMVGEAFKPIAAERQIEYAIRMEDVPRTFVGDPDRLNQVLLNLLDNAFKYTPQGGRVTLVGRTAGGALEIEVADNGPGIPPDQLSVIFEKYGRARTRAQGGQRGTGLGLAVANGIVLAHQGKLSVVSEPGKGSRFLVRLPLKTEAQILAQAQEVA